MIITATYDTVTTSPPFYMAAINEAIQIMTGKFAGNGANFGIQFGWGSINNSTSSFTSSGGQSLYNLYEESEGAAGVAQLKSFLTANALTQYAKAAAASIPGSGDPTSGGTLWLTVAHVQCLLGTGVIPAGSLVGYVGINPSLSFFDRAFGVGSGYDLVGMICHEISEVMGRFRGCLQSFSGTNWYTALDFMSYKSGALDFTPYASGSYASHDGGITHLNTWNTAGSGDYGDWNGATNDSFNDTSSSGVLNSISENDIILMDAIGWQAGPIPAISGSGIGHGF